MISRAQAAEIARAFLLGRGSEASPPVGAHLGSTRPPEIAEVRCKEDAPLSGVAAYKLGPVPPDYWIVYLRNPDPFAIRSSKIVLVGKAGGEILYYGIAGGEG